MPATQVDYVVALARMRTEWQTILGEEDPVPAWECEVARMRAELHDLRANGLWRSGKRTLLGAIGVHHDEVIMCRGLSWLLTPDGWHGLGSRVLDGLVGYLGVERAGAAHATVVVEESRDDTRADIIVRFGSTTILIEAKVWALEQPRQCDRLAHHWAEESPTLVFLTRNGGGPVTAVESKEAWHALAWSDVATLVQTAIERSPECEPGVHEYLRTLEIYGGNRS